MSSRFATEAAFEHLAPLLRTQIAQRGQHKTFVAELQLIEPIGKLDGAAAFAAHQAFALKRRRFPLLNVRQRCAEPAVGAALAGAATLSRAARVPAIQEFTRPLADHGSQVLDAQVGGGLVVGCDHLPEFVEHQSRPGKDLQHSLQQRVGLQPRMGLAYGRLGRAPSRRRVGRPLLRLSQQALNAPQDGLGVARTPRRIKLGHLAQQCLAATRPDRNA